MAIGGDLPPDAVGRGGSRREFAVGPRGDEVRDHRVAQSVGRHRAVCALAPDVDGVARAGEAKRGRGPQCEAARATQGERPRKRDGGQGRGRGPHRGPQRFGEHPRHGGERAEGAVAHRDRRRARRERPNATQPHGRERVVEREPPQQQRKRRGDQRDGDHPREREGERELVEVVDRERCGGRGGRERHREQVGAERDDAVAAAQPTPQGRVEGEDPRHGHVAELEPQLEHQLRVEQQQQERTQAQAVEGVSLLAQRRAGEQDAEHERRAPHARREPRHPGVGRQADPQRDQRADPPARPPSAQRREQPQEQARDDAGVQARDREHVDGARAHVVVARGVVQPAAVPEDEGARHAGHRGIRGGGVEAGGDVGAEARDGGGRRRRAQDAEPAGPHERVVPDALPREVGAVVERSRVERAVDLLQARRGQHDGPGADGVAGEPGLEHEAHPRARRRPRPRHADASEPYVGLRPRIAPRRGHALDLGHEIRDVPFGGRHDLRGGHPTEPHT